MFEILLSSLLIFQPQKRCDFSACYVSIIISAIAPKHNKKGKNNS